MMWEKTDIRPVLDAGVVEPGGAPAACETPGVAAADLIRIAQGCYAIFWGLLMTVIVSTQLVVAPRFRMLAEMLLGVGVFVVLTGSWRLVQVRLSASAMWRRRTRSAFAAAGLMAYFCVLFYFWLRLPASRYLAANALAFVGATILFLVLFCRVMAALGAVMKEPQLTQEARVYAVSSALLLGAPFAGVATLLLVTTLMRREDVANSVFAWFWRANPAALLLLLLPFSLTLALAWAAKDTVLRRLIADTSSAPATGAPQ